MTERQRKRARWQLTELAETIAQAVSKASVDPGKCWYEEAAKAVVEAGWSRRPAKGV